MARSRPLVRHVVRRYARDAVDRDDLAQDCLFWILRRYPEYNPAKCGWDDWVFQACDACCRQIRAKETRRARLSRRVVLDSDGDGMQASPEDDRGGSLVFAANELDGPLSILLRTERNSHLAEIVSSLDSQSRGLIARLYGLDGRPPAETIAETASHFGIPAPSCAKQIRAALAALRESITSEVLE